MSGLEPGSINGKNGRFSIWRIPNFLLEPRGDYFHEPDDRIERLSKYRSLAGGAIVIGMIVYYSGLSHTGYTRTGGALGGADITLNTPEGNWLTGIVVTISAAILVIPVVSLILILTAERPYRRATLYQLRWLAIAAGFRRAVRGNHRPSRSTGLPREVTDAPPCRRHHRPSLASDRDHSPGLALQRPVPDRHGIVPRGRRPPPARARLRDSYRLDSRARHVLRGQDRRLGRCGDTRQDRRLRRGSHSDHHQRDDTDAVKKHPHWAFRRGPNQLTG